MLFSGTYVTDFYKRIRDLLHEEVRSRQPLDDAWLELERQERSHRAPAAVAGAR